MAVCGESVEQSTLSLNIVQAPVTYDYVNNVSEFAGSVLHCCICPICSNPFVQPRQAACAHVFCAACWANHLQNSSLCPICRQEVGNSLGDADRTLRQLLDSLPVRCSNRALGCTWTGPRGNLQEHLDRTCENHACPCIARGCVWRGLRSALVGHTEERCEFVDAACMNQCGFVGQRNKLPEHVERECVVTKRRQEEERQREAERQEQERKRIEEARKEEEHKALQKLRAEEEELYQSLFPNPAEVIHLNVGGVKMSVGRKMLAKHPQSLLARAFDTAAPDTRFPVPALGADGCVFIDRNPKVFVVVLDWLRTEVLPEGLSANDLSLLDAESRVWKLHQLKEALEARKNDLLSAPISQDALYICLAGAAGQFLLLPGVNATGRCFAGAMLGNARLSRARLSSTNFKDAVLTSADLSHVDFTNADLKGANLARANLANAVLTNATLDTSNAKLFSVNFSEVDLIGRDFSNTDLTGAIFTKANLTNANFTNARLSSANLSSANLTGAILTNAILISANLTQTDLTNANLTNANLAGANLNRACLTNVNLTNANLAGANLTGAVLGNNILTGANFTRATGMNRKENSKMLPEF